jgi:hypothetical protein
MSSVAHSPSEQAQLVSAPSWEWIVDGVRPGTLRPPALKPDFHGPQHLLTLSSVEDDGLGEELQVIWEIEPGAKVIEKVAPPETAGFDPPDKLVPVRWGAASTAAYLLAATSVPDEARQMAVEKAESGDEITFATDREIGTEAKKKRRPRREKTIPADKLALRLLGVLERYKERWNPKELAYLALHLREFADALEKPERGGKKKARG